MKRVITAFIASSELSLMVLGALADPINKNIFGTALKGYDAVAYFKESKLYLNYNKEVQQKWEADLPGFIKKGQENWPRLSKC